MMIDWSDEEIADIAGVAVAQLALTLLVPGPERVVVPPRAAPEPVLRALLAAAEGRGVEVVFTGRHLDMVRYGGYYLIWPPLPLRGDPEGCFVVRSVEPGGAPVASDPGEAAEAARAAAEFALLSAWFRSGPGPRRGPRASRRRPGPVARGGRRDG